MENNEFIMANAKKEFWQNNLGQNDYKKRNS